MDLLIVVSFKVSLFYSKNMNTFFDIIHYFTIFATWLSRKRYELQIS